MTGSSEEEEDKISKGRTTQEKLLFVRGSGGQKNNMRLRLDLKKENVPKLLALSCRKLYAGLIIPYFRMITFTLEPKFYLPKTLRLNPQRAILQDLDLPI